MKRSKKIARNDRSAKIAGIEPQIFAGSVHQCLSVVRFCFSDFPMSRLPDFPISGSFFFQRSLLFLQACFLHLRERYMF